MITFLATQSDINFNLELGIRGEWGLAALVAISVVLVAALLYGLL